MAELIWQNWYGRIDMAELIWQNWYGRIYMAEFIWQNLYGRFEAINLISGFHWVHLCRPIYSVDVEWLFKVNILDLIVLQLLSTSTDDTSVAV